MDNDLDKRLRALELGQRQLADEQQQILETLQELAALMRAPDEEGEKLHEVLAQLAAVIGTNTVVLRDLKNAVTGKPEGSA